MRDYKFRGLKIDGRGWVYGDLVQTKPFTYILSTSFIPVLSLSSDYFTEVNEKTVGQFTGLKDKTGIDIYEGDILMDHGIVAWNDVEHRWSVIDLNWNDKRVWHNIDYLTSPFEIIGNIHMNKELLES